MTRRWVIPDGAEPFPGREEGVAAILGRMREQSRRNRRERMANVNRGNGRKRRARTVRRHGTVFHAGAARLEARGRA